MREKRYVTAELTSDYSSKIVNHVEKAKGVVDSSSRAYELIQTIGAAARDRDGVVVAENYHTLRRHLESGAEDDEVMGASIMNGRKKQVLEDLLTTAGVVYAHVYDDDELGSRTVRSQHVFEHTARRE